MNYDGAAFIYLMVFMIVLGAYGAAGLAGAGVMLLLILAWAASATRG